MERLRSHWLRILTHAACIAPLVLLVWGYTRDQLTFNPVQAIILRTGTIALVLLVLSLLCTPLNTLLGLRQALPLRRPLGLYAFFYTSLHLLAYVALDFGLDWGLLWQEVVEKRHLVAGYGAFLLLIPLALTSTKGWQRRLGKRWKLLHQLVYLAAPLAVLHFLWIVKADYREPLLYGTVVAALLALRIPALRRRLIGLRQARTGLGSQEPAPRGH